MLSDLYEIKKKESQSFTIKLASCEHDIFQAHFPRNPLLPGFVMLEICSKVLKHEIVVIKKAKFLNPALANDELEFLLKQDKRKVSVKILKESIKIAEIVYEKI